MNGEVKLDQPATFPEGARVTVVLGVEEEEFYPSPIATETHVEFLASLRESIAETQAGVRGHSVDEAFSILEAELRQTADAPQG